MALGDSVAGQGWGVTRRGFIGRALAGFAAVPVLGAIVPELRHITGLVLDSNRGYVRWSDGELSPIPANTGPVLLSDAHGLGIDMTRREDDWLIHRVWMPKNHPNTLSGDLKINGVLFPWTYVP